MKIKILFVLLALAGAVHASDDMAPYNRSQIMISRFGRVDRQMLYTRVLALPATLRKYLVGQDEMGLALQARLIQYLNSLGHRTEEPVALHIVGPSGVGKTSLMKVLAELGIRVERLDAQDFSGEGDGNSITYRLNFRLLQILATRKSPDEPLILFIDELDKAAELDQFEKKGHNQPIITALNGILSEGRIMINGKIVGFSNIFMLSASNFHPEQIEKFSKQITKKQKPFWDFTDEELGKFDKWVRSGENSFAGTANLLSGLFRSNTIGRLLPDVVVAKTLVQPDFEEIVERVQTSLRGRLTGKEDGTLKIDATAAFVDFLKAQSIYGPAGARMPRKRVEQLVEGIVSLALRFDLGDRESLTLPREITLDMKDEKTALVHVRAFKRVGTKKRLFKEIKKTIAYNAGAGAFVPPSEGLATWLPAAASEKAEEYAKGQDSRPPTGEQIAQARRALKNPGEIKDYVGAFVFDQTKLIDEINRKLHLYMNAHDPHVDLMTVPGFTGTGKSDAFVLAADAAGIPVVTINMQEYAGTDIESAGRLGERLSDELIEARKKANGKVMLLIEELDKCFEVDPTGGAPVTRPALALIKDLLNSGTRTVSVKQGLSGMDLREIDITGVFTALTMNFPTERFDLKADPRRTSIRDMQRLQRNIAFSPQTMRDVLAQLFAADTINRLMAGSLMIANVLSEEGYRSIIQDQLAEALPYVNADPDDPEHQVSLELEASEEYLERYLFEDAVIPSEGGRQSAWNAVRVIKDDVLEALQRLPTKGPAFRRPLTLHLDYAEATADHGPMVTVRASLRDEKDRERYPKVGTFELYAQERQLRFPPPREFKRLSKERAIISIHEFGHAYGGVMLGQRFSEVLVTQPQPLVKFYEMPFMTGNMHAVQIYTMLAAKAMERVVLGAAGSKPESFFAATSGSSNDISEATRSLYAMVHKLGMDPEGCTIERGGLAGCGQDDFGKRRYSFAELPANEQLRLGRILRKMEDHMVELFEKAQDQRWYAQKIKSLARAGNMTEVEFYALIDQPRAPDRHAFIGEEVDLKELSPDAIEPEAAETRVARDHKQAKTDKTAAELVKDATGALRGWLDEKTCGEAVGI